MLDTQLEAFCQPYKDAIDGNEYDHDPIIITIRTKRGAKNPKKCLGALIKVVSKKFADNSQSKDGGGGGGGVQACHFYAKNGA
eukprot:gene22919-12013_t